MGETKLHLKGYFNIQGLKMEQKYFRKYVDL